MLSYQLAAKQYIPKDKKIKVLLIAESPPHYDEGEQQGKPIRIQVGKTTCAVSDTGSLRLE